MMQEVEVLKTIPELVCSYFSEEQFTLSDYAAIVDKVIDLWCTKDVTNGSSVQSELFFVSRVSIFYM